MGKGRSNQGKGQSSQRANFHEVFLGGGEEFRLG
jgi:hypothetical protein